MDDSRPFVLQDSTTSGVNYLSTWKIAVCQIVSLVIYWLVILLLSIDGVHAMKRCDVIFLTFYCQAALWLITLIVDHYYKWQHHLLFLKGHFEFHKVVSKFSSLMFIALSFFNGVFLVFGGCLFFEFKNITNICEPNALLIPIISLIVGVGVQIFVLISLLLIYTVNVLRFNKEQPVADVRRVSSWIPQNSSSVLEVGYRDKGEDLDDLLQKQADLIQYYKGKIEYLNEKIMMLSHHSMDC